MIFGVIDIGSNTIRIVVYKVQNNSFECLFNEKKFVQLISYVKNRHIRDEGVQYMILAIKQLIQLAMPFQPIKIYCFATAPFRAVDNPMQLTMAVQFATGLEVEILSGEEEAYFGLTGAQYLHGTANGLFVDLGGGSLEISLLKDGNIKYAQSLDFGCVSVADRFTSGILPSKDEIRKIKCFADARIDKLNWLHEAKDADMYCLGGTARALGHLHKARNGSAATIDEYSFDVKEIKTEYQSIIEMGTDGIRLISKNCPGRMFTLIPGLVVLQRLAKKSGAVKIFFSTYGVREGFLIKRILPKCAPLEPVNISSIFARESQESLEKNYDQLRKRLCGN